MYHVTVFPKRANRLEPRKKKSEVDKGDFKKLEQGDCCVLFSTHSRQAPCKHRWCSVQHSLTRLGKPSVELKKLTFALKPVRRAWRHQPLHYANLDGFLFLLSHATYSPALNHLSSQIHFKQSLSFLLSSITFLFKHQIICNVIMQRVNVDSDGNILFKPKQCFIR